MNAIDRSALTHTASHSKFSEFHRTRFAVVYVRQSTPQQVVENRESLDRQYALAQQAREWGWPQQRVLIIDDDLGQSGRTADHRNGFQRLLAEVTMDHVGLVMGLEMSRLARSCKDWHHLLELCALFGTLLADQDGVYDPGDPNDRLLLGLKGQISKLEMHTIRSRLSRGLLNKARRGELFLHAPLGYVKTPSGTLDFDPDEQVRQVMHLLFEKFEELGTSQGLRRYFQQNQICLGVRPFHGLHHGELEWRPAAMSTISRILRHPVYAGVATYGRTPNDPKRRRPNGKPRVRHLPREEWGIVVPDKVPAYITWDQYLLNQQRLRENRCTASTPGAPRKGRALLGGLVVCGRCGSKMNALYGSTLVPRYECVRHLREGRPSRCMGTGAAAVDQLVSGQVLRVISPVGIDLSLRAADNVEKERHRLAEHWQSRIERADYEAQLAERHYRAVDPENRLVARTLEQAWEAALRNVQSIQESFDRFQHELPLQLSKADLAHIRSLSTDLPKLWNAAETTAQDKKQIIRILVRQVTITMENSSEKATLQIAWHGGAVTSHAWRRGVSRYEQLSNFEELKARVTECHQAEMTASQISTILNQEGFQPASPRIDEFNRNSVTSLISRLGLSTPRRPKQKLQDHEWCQRDLAEHLGITVTRLNHWVRKGYVHTRTVGRKQNVITWADPDEMERLKRLRDHPRPHRLTPFPQELTQPKPRPQGEPETIKDQ